MVVNRHAGIDPNTRDDAKADTVSWIGEQVAVLKASGDFEKARKSLTQVGLRTVKGRWIVLMTEASILPVNKRPRLAIRLHSSN